MKYAFLLGGSKDIAIQELISMGVTNTRESGTFLFGDIDADIPALQDRLGGTVKISIIRAEEDESSFFSSLLTLLEQSSQGKKVHMMCNVYGKPDTEVLSWVLPELKKQSSVPIRYLNQQYKNVASVLFLKRQHEKQTTEWNCIFDGKKVYITQTLAAQNVDAYSMRDVARPYRDMKNGVMPPKLCQMLLNIAGGDTVWDPFCGNGTLVAEGVLQGKMMYGSDIVDRLVESTEQNLQWLESVYADEFPLKQPLQYACFTHDVREPSELKVDTVCSEGFLGTPMKKFALKKDLLQTDAYLTELYGAAFSRFAQRGITRIVICLPWYTMRHALGRMDATHQAIEELGYRCTWSSLYGKHQRVKREVCIFEK